MSKSGVALASALLIGGFAPAPARDWPVTAGWEIHEADSFCYMWSDYEGPGDTELSLAVNTADEVMIIVQNSDWSVDADVSYKLGADMDGLMAYGSATGIRDKTYPYKKGLQAKVAVPGFLEAFAKSSYLHFYLDRSDASDFDPDTAIVLDKLDLEGSAAALAQVQRCKKEVRRKREAEAQEKADYEARWRSIPKDPFTVPGPKSDE